MVLGLLSHLNAHQFPLETIEFNKRCSAAVSFMMSVAMAVAETYFKKVKPMTIPKHLGPESELSSKEILHFVGCLEPFNGLRFNLHHAFKQARPSSLDQSVVVW